MIDENYHIADLDDLDNDDTSDTIENSSDSHSEQKNQKVEIVDDEDTAIGNITMKEKPVLRTKVIYESSDTSDDDKYKAEHSFNFSENEYEGRSEEKNFRNEEENSYYEEFENKSQSKSSEGTKRRRLLVEEWMLDMYYKRPNTFKATIIGIILAILILLIGFLKTLLIFVVVLIANIVGQLLDSNPRIMSIIEAISRRLK